MRKKTDETKREKEKSGKYKKANEKKQQHPTQKWY